MNVLHSRSTTIVLCIVLALVAVSVMGCAAASGTEGTTSAQQTGTMKPASDTSMSGEMTSSDPEDQVCSVCNGKGEAPVTPGSAEKVEGVQTIAIGVEDGYFSPNTFTVAAGEPVSVTFSGKAAGCLGKPTFKSLGKKGDFTQTEKVTIDLGVLAPGTYEFTCGMGQPGGTIVAK